MGTTATCLMKPESQDNDMSSSPARDTPGVPSLLGTDTRLCPDASGQPGPVLKEYLLQNAPDVQGWANKAGDVFFEKQRQQADHADGNTVRFFYQMMKAIATEMNQATGALRVQRKGRGRARILDFCTAPGGFLESAMEMNFGATAMGFSLPPTQGGHEIIMPLSSSVTFKYADVTMFAGDMGYTDIPRDNPDAENFVLERRISPDQRFDLIFCDGQVLRTHARAAYREQWEARRLAATQLAIGLQHVSPGGTMVVLLHKLDAVHTVSLIYAFSKFSRIKLFKPRRAHAKRSSFYMIAANIQSNSLHAREAMESWRLMWRVMTFASDEERQRISESHVDERVLVEQFGPELVRLGREIWEIQARALEKAPFMQAGQNEGRKTSWRTPLPGNKAADGKLV
ncbi:hypothetical protein Trco_001523 [Trichoderma cornu-damae]|uniref:Ribosomal RNA methyltransferase FtsJ domain-containing protein n=1 Tax=Trichoderma cornu-damae TaxID=654480 RepID=A0A9P8QZ82_9HYPO|nr:hypothetical protein Trco_001523 [Trichoderma cornu-damae]